MKFLLFVITTLFVCIGALGQLPQTSWLDYENDANGDGLLFKTDYGFLSFCGFVPLETDQFGILVTGIAPNHSVLFNKPVSSDTINYGMYLGQSVIKANDYGFYQMLFYNNNFQTFGRPMLIRYNDMGDIIWTKTYFEGTNWEYRDFVLTQTSDGNLYLAGTHVINPFDDITDNNQVLMKLNSEGEYQWHEEFSDLVSVWNYSIIATDDALVVGGRMCLNDNDVITYQFRQFVRKFNYSGVSQWFNKIHVSPAGAEEGAYSVIQLANGNYLYASGRSEGTLSGQGETSNGEIQIVVGEINSLLGDTIYENGYQDHQLNQKFFKLIKIEGGGYIGVGQHTDYFDGPSQGWPIGFMIKLDANLNQEWYRYYVPSIWEGMGRWNNLTDVVENDNGTFTAIGLIYTYTGDGPQGGFIQDTYLITVDSLGCLVPGCGVSVQEFEATDNLLFYPNPAADHFSVEFPHRDNWTIALYNQQGQLVRNEKINQSNRANFEITNLPSGFYTVKCMATDGRLFINKIIKD
jgi:Secretion system C-terminal sorting domain